MIHAIAAASGGPGPMPGMNMGGSSGPGLMWMPTQPLTLTRLLAWHPQPVPAMPALCLLLAAGYLAGVWTLRRRGDHWPVGRVVCWLTGLLTVVAVTATGIGGYSMELFSVHMTQHMTLSMLSPILLLLGAPVTLTLRALPVAHYGRRGPREMLVQLLHSRFARVVTSPFFTLPLFIASLYGLYFTPIFDWLMGTWWGHGLMMTHFLAVGLLFFYPILGIDPGPTARKPVFGILELFCGMPFHAFFGIALMMSSSLVAGVFAHPAASLAVNPLADQRTAGGLAWAFGEIPTLIVLLVVFLQWHRGEQRTARRQDRAADRDHDAELTAYNAYLADLADLARHGRR